MMSGKYHVKLGHFFRFRTFRAKCLVRLPTQSSLSSYAPIRHAVFVLRLCRYSHVIIRPRSVCHAVRHEITSPDVRHFTPVDPVMLSAPSENSKLHATHGIYTFMLVLQAGFVHEYLRLTACELYDSIMRYDPARDTALPAPG